MVQVVRRRLPSEESWVQSQSALWDLWSAEWHCHSFLTEPCRYDCSSAAQSSSAVRHVTSRRCVSVEATDRLVVWPVLHPTADFSTRVFVFAAECCWRGVGVFTTANSLFQSSAIVWYWILSVMRIAGPSCGCAFNWTQYGAQCGLEVTSLCAPCSGGTAPPLLNLRN